MTKLDRSISIDFRYQSINHNRFRSITIDFNRASKILICNVLLFNRLNEHIEGFQSFTSFLNNYF